MQDTKQTHVKVTMPKDLYSRLVTESLNVLGEENLSQMIRTILRKHLIISKNHLEIHLII